MSRQDNLKPFQKGQSGNPNGRPKKNPKIDLILKKVLEEKESDANLTKLELIIRGITERAKNGDLESINYILNRVYGNIKSKQLGIIIDVSKEDLCSEFFLHEAIKKMRKLYNLTLDQLSEKIKNEYSMKISSNMLGKIERGDAQISARLFLIYASIRDSIQS